MKTIMINAISVKTGGGVILLTHMLDGMRKSNKNIKWIVVVNQSLTNCIKSDESVITLTFPWAEKNPIFFFYWHEFFLSQLIIKFQVDLFFSQINILPIKKLPCPTLLLVHHAGYFSDEFYSLFKNVYSSAKNKVGWFLRKYLIKKSIAKANHVTVQTKAL